MTEKSTIRASRFRPAALPLLAGLIVMGATLFLSYAFRQRERHHIRHMTQMVAGGVKADIEADLETRFLGPMRHADLWTINSQTTQEAWQAKAQIFLQEHPDISAVEWAGTDHRRWSLPEDWAQAAEGETEKDVKSAARSATEAERAGARLPVLSHAAIMVDKLAVRRVLLPIYRDGKLEGIGTAAFQERQALDSLLGDVSGLGYAITLSENGHGTYRQAGTTDDFSQEWGADAGVSSPGIKWTVRVWPTQGLISEMRTDLPQFIFGMGLALSLLVALATHFAQSLKIKNQSLTAEIAGRMRTQAALEASQERLNGILETTPDAVVAVDEQQRIRLFNKGAETLFGYQADEVMGAPLDLLLPSRFQTSHRGEINKFGEAQIVRTKRMGGPREVFGRRRDGSEFPVEASISKLRTPDGNIYTSILRDVTERVQAREALARAHADLEARVQERTAELARANDLLGNEIRERANAESMLRSSERRLQAILDNCTAVIYMKNIEGHYLLINRWYEILFNLKNDNIVGKTDYDIFPEEIATALRKNDQQVIQSENPIEFEEVVVHPDGTLHTYIALKFLIRDADQKAYAVCGISTDITKQKQSEAMLSELSGGLMQLQDEERQRLAHDLHEGTAQMLAALGINLGMAQRAASEENKMLRSTLDVSAELAEQTANQVKRMAYLLHPPGLDEFGLASALRWYAEGFSRRSGIAVAVNISSNLERFDRDVEVAVFRILQEGLSNVLRHSGSKSAEITVQQDEYQLVLEIADKGHGLPTQIQDRVISGLPVPGMGITSMRERARQLGGALQILSTARGIKVIARLPIDRGRKADVVENRETVS